MGGWLRSHLGAQRPGGPACPAGVPISPEKWGERGPGLRPWTPGFMARSLSFARFGDRWLWYDSGAVSSGMLRPIWDAFSRENMLESIFAKESFQIRARKWLQMKTTIVPLRPTTPKRASANERAIKKGGGGHPPATLCVRAFSRESLDPPPGTGRKPTSQGLTCAGPNQDHLPKTDSVEPPTQRPRRGASLPSAGGPAETFAG